MASALSVPSALKYGPPMPKNAKPLVAPIFSAVTLPVFGVSSEVDTVLGVSSFSKAKSARRKTNWSIVISALPFDAQDPGGEVDRDDRIGLERAGLDVELAARQLGEVDRLRHAVGRCRCPC